jgi:hypothetical protein
VWPVLSGLVFLLRSPGIAYNEVVVALLDRPGSTRNLLRFAWLLAMITSALHLLLALTPLAGLYFSRLSALPADLVQIARIGLIIALPLPAVSTFQSWFQGQLLYGKQTRAVPEAVVVFLSVVVAVMALGLAFGQQFTGLYIVMIGFVLANLGQAAWQWMRGRKVSAALQQRDFYNP